jgi:hypothetical protein
LYVVRHYLLLLLGYITFMNPQDSVPVSAPVPQADSASVNTKLAGPIELLKFGWDLLTGHWKSIAPIMLLPVILMDVGMLLSYNKNVVTMVLSLLIIIIAVVVTFASAPAIVNAVHNVSTNPATPVSFKEQYRFGFSYFWSYILVAIICGFVGLGSMILLVIPGIIVIVYISFYQYALVVDGKKGFSSLTESYSIVKGRWWGAVGRFLFLGIVMLIIGIIVSGANYLVGLVFGVSVTDAGSTLGQAPFGMLVSNMIIGLVSNTIVGLISLGYTYKMYISFKATRNQSVSQSSFKHWLIAFICIGVIGGILLFITVPIVAMNSARLKSQQANVDVQAVMAEIQAEILKSTGTTSTPVAQ